MQPDSWLTRWLPMIRQHAEETPIFEVGCGSGADTATLVSAGLEVVAIDLSPAAIERARKYVPSATFLTRDVRQEFPQQVQGTGVIIASLSLHYFAWAETVTLFNRVQQTLRQGGLFVCRLNSTKDVNFGALGHPEIEPNYYQVEGEAKRFFNQASIELLLSNGWAILSLDHMSTNKYSKPKALWECLCTKSAV